MHLIGKTKANCEDNGLEQTVNIINHMKSLKSLQKGGDKMKDKCTDSPSFMCRGRKITIN